MAGTSSIAQKLKLSFRSGCGRMTAQRAGVAVLLALIVAGGVARAEAIGGNDRVSADEEGYVANTNRILAGRPYATFKWPPATSIVFALATGAAGHSSLRLAAHAHGPAQIAQLAIGVFVLAAVAAIAWLAAGLWAALLAVALAASYDPLIVSTRTFLSEPLGALALLAAIAAAVLAHRRIAKRRAGNWSLALAGAVGGLACLARGDLLVAMGVIALALALAGRPGARVALVRAGVYLGALALALSPWVAYASSREGRFVPITTAGPDAFFVGSYLPGKGLLVPTEESLAPSVCRHFPRDCGPYWQRSSAPLFALIRARDPGASESSAVVKADLENIGNYALGRPLAFASMLAGKFWAMWTSAWSGGNGTRRADTSETQHLLYVVIAWLGLLAGILATRRWLLIVSAGVLLSVAGLATLFNDQPRYNVSLMPLLFAAGAAGLWLAGERAMRTLRSGPHDGRGDAVSTPERAAAAPQPPAAALEDPPRARS
jgi:4-amino-4-deoxy-L-arabinose transferase-like glycosyltransferase